MQILDQYRGTVVACQYRIPPALACTESFPKLRDTLHDAIIRVVLAQPHMHVGIIGVESKKPGFVRLDNLDLRNHIHWTYVDESTHHDSLYVESLQTRLDSRYDNFATRPGWNIVILYRIGSDIMDIIYTWNHTHHDGMSAKIFHRSLLRNLANNYTSNREPIFNVSDSPSSWIINLPDSSARLPPNPEKLSSWPMTPKFLVQTLWKKLKPTWLFPPGAVYAHWAPIRTTPFKTRLGNFTIKSGTVTRIITPCREHNTTVTGLLQALILISLTSAIENAKGFASLTPYDLRKILPSKPPQYPWLEPDQSMCNYVSIVEHEYDAELTAAIRSKMSSYSTQGCLPDTVMNTMWSVAARIRREIEARLHSALWNDLIGIMKLCHDWTAQQKSETEKIRYLSWLVTNLGVLDGDQNGSWSIRRAELALSVDVHSAAFSVSVMTIKGGDMCVTCSWQDCVVDPSLGERLLGDLERWLSAIGTA